MKIIEWVKNNKLSSVLILIVAYLVFSEGSARFFGTMLSSRYAVPNYGVSMEKMSAPASLGIGGGGYDYYGPMPSESVDLNAQNRKIVQETNLSVQVDNVSSSINQIKVQAISLGGFMVSANLSKPMEAASGSITIRVPAQKMDTMLDIIRKGAVKVVSEYLMGYDVTDQYTDIASRLETLEKTKMIFENMLDKATDVDDILRVQREILNTQNQIDSYKGQAKYLEDTASSVKITVYLSTDEYSLPYAPQDGFRPNVIFKQAVRALVLTLRGLAAKGIWIAVYSVIWVPILVAVILIRKFLKSRKTLKKAS